jgi:hypothetical protein
MRIGLFTMNAAAIAAASRPPSSAASATPAAAARTPHAKAKSFSWISPAPATRVYPASSTFNRGGV